MAGGAMAGSVAVPVGNIADRLIDVLCTSAGRMKVGPTDGGADVEMIDRINIRQAAWRAMQMALDKLEPRPQHVLVDGLRIKWLPYAQTALVQGDAKSYSIAAASVLAKVTRDRLMREYDQQYPGYGFAQHKGYGTEMHLAALQEYGVTPHHRRSFAPVRERVAQLNLFTTEILS